jgi:hypothetical protein
MGRKYIGQRRKNMMHTDRFKVRNKEFLNLAAQIDSHLISNNRVEKISEVYTLTSKLFGGLSVHLAVKDKVFYPYYLQSTNETIKSTVRHFMREIGGLATTLDNHKNKWATLSKINSAPEDFISETKEIINLIKYRAKTENEEIYPLIDKDANPKSHMSDNFKLLSVVPSHELLRSKSA